MLVCSVVSGMWYSDAPQKVSVGCVKHSWESEPKPVARIFRASCLQQQLEESQRSHWLLMPMLTAWGQHGFVHLCEPTMPPHGYSPLQQDHTV